MPATGVSTTARGVAAPTAARRMSTAATGRVSAARRARMASRARRTVRTAITRGSARGTVTRCSTRSAIAGRAMIAAVSTVWCTRISAVGRASRDRLPHIQLRTGRGRSASVASGRRTAPARLHRTRSGPVPVGTTAAAGSGAVRLAAWRGVPRWRRERPEAVTVASGSKLRCSALRFHVPRTRVG